MPRPSPLLTRRPAKVVQPHDDPLVVTLQIANHNVHQILVDIGSSVDVLFRSAYDQMGLPPTILKPIDAPFCGFFSHNIQPNGGVELLVTMGTYPAQAAILTNFLMVDTPDIYNAIIGCPTMNTLRAVASTYHLALKFPTPARVGVILGNQVEARCCYVLALKRPPNT